MSTTTSISQKRLLRDWKEIQDDPDLKYFAVHPVGDDLFEWHVNFKPTEGLYCGILFHVIVKFNSHLGKPLYPHSPPVIQLCSKLHHPNVFYNWYGQEEGGFPYICLDLLKDRSSYSPNYSGWSSAYTLGSILMQLSSFFFDSHIEQEGGYVETITLSGDQLEECRQSSRAFTCQTCGHTHDNPFPMIVAQQPVQASTEEKLQDKPSSVNLADNADVMHTILEFVPEKSMEVCKQVEQSWQSSMDKISSKREIVCFHSKIPLGEDVIGIGINVDYFENRRNNQSQNQTRKVLRNVSSEFDYLSHSAFQSGVRSSTWNKKITHFIPLVIDRENFGKGYPILINSLKHVLQTNIIGSEEMLSFFTSFMNTIVVELFKVGNNGQINRYASEKALIGYTCIHHLLLTLLSRYPKMKDIANQRIRDFMATDDNRTKKAIPDLGKFLVYLVISDSELNWDLIKYTYLKETFIRNVLWMVRENQQLANEKLPMDQRLQMTFASKSFSTSRSLIMFQCYFLNNVARPEGKTNTQMLSHYNNCFGRPSHQDMDKLQTRCREILAVNDWMGYFKMLYVSIPPKDKFYNILVDSVKQSKRLKYHGNKSNGHWRQNNRRHRNNRRY